MLDRAVLHVIDHVAAVHSIDDQAIQSFALTVCQLV